MLQKEAHKKLVVFAPLNWGLGHASRIIPLVEQYQNKNWRVIIASDGVALKFLQIEFPHLEILNTNSKELQYSSSKKASLLKHLIKIIPSFLRNIKSDKEFVQKLVEKEKIDLIISDNRYGFRHSEIKSILITHQLKLAIPPSLRLGQFFVKRQLNKWINTFDECWIVDNQEHQYAGNLSSNSQLKIPSKFIGLQSRLSKKEVEKDIDFLVVLSGLEPQRSILENLIIEALKDIKGRNVIIGGHFGNISSNTNIQYQSFANTKELESLINRAKCIISRSGYSSIMDFIKLRKKAILIPTQGQPEQEYLAKFHSSNPLFYIAENNLTSIRTRIDMCLKNTMLE